MCSHGRSALAEPLVEMVVCTPDPYIADEGAVNQSIWGGWAVDHIAPPLNHKCGPAAKSVEDEYRIQSSNKRAGSLQLNFLILYVNCK